MSPHVSTLRITVIGAATLALAIGIGRFAFTPLLPMMREDGLAGVSEGGILAAVHFLGYWLGAVFAASLPLPPRLLMRCSLIAIGVATAAMGLTENVAFWLVLRWITGICSAWVLVLIGNYYVKQLADAGRPGLQGWIFCGVGVGIAGVGLLCLLLMANAVGAAAAWQIIGGISTAAMATICLYLGPEIPAQRAPGRRRCNHRAPLDWRVVTAYGTVGLSYIIPATYLPLMARKILPATLTFGWAWPVFGAAAFASTIVAAELQRRFSNRQIWAASHAIMAVGLLLPAIAPHFATIIAAGLCVGGTFMIVTMAGVKEAHRIAPPQDAMRHIAALTAAFAMGQMVGPVLASAVHALTDSFAVPLVMCSILLAVTALRLRDKGGIRPLPPCDPAGARSLKRRYENHVS